MKNTRLLFLTAVVGGLALGGCTVGPDYVQPEIEEPDAWHTAAVEGLEEGEATLQTWWTVFDDEKLTELVMRSAGGNLDLRSALWKVEEARALRGVFASNRKPQVGFEADANRSQPSENGIFSPIAGDEGFEASNQFTTGFGASWELDVFGRILRQVEAADAATQASVEAYRDVLVSLYAETALAYVNVRASQERLRIAHTNVETQEDTLQLTKDRFDSGLVSALDVAQAESNLANTESEIPALEQSLEFALNRLSDKRENRQKVIVEHRQMFSRQKTCSYLHSYV